MSSKNEFFEIKNITNKPILILDPIYENITKLAAIGGEICVSNMAEFELLKIEAKRNKKVIYKIHIKINTGMNRFGFNSLSDIMQVIEVSQKTQNIFIRGVFSHFYDAKNSESAEKQLLLFSDFKEKLLEKYNLNKTIFHISNSDGLDDFAVFDMVRAGLKIYNDTSHETIKLKSKIIEFQELKIGESAGYSKCFIAKKETSIAVVAIGYADGIMRRIAGRGFVLVNDSFCQILAVCMDSIIVDVTNVECKLYDDVILIGKDNQNQIFICDVATWCDTIPYEIITRIGARVKRRYVAGEICKLLQESIEQEN